MNIGALEVSIAAFLSAKINNPKVAVNPIPETEADFEKAFGKEIILVAFSEEEPNPDLKALSVVYQNTEVTFAFLVQTTSLRGRDDKVGVYALLDLIKKNIVGYEPLPGQPFVFFGMKMQDKVNDVFQYAIYFKTKSFVMQHTDNNDTHEVSLNQVNFN